MRLAIPAALLGLLAAACSSPSATDNPAGNALGNAQAMLVLDKTPWNGCVATVRGALEPIPGISKVDIQAQKKDFTVHYDASKTNVEQMLEVLKAKGESAQVKK